MDCYSGKCEHCRVELEHVCHGPGAPGTTEVYSTEGGQRVQFPPDDYDKWFPFDGGPTDEEDE